MVCIYWLNISTHKKREPFASILVCSGLDSHLFQYMQKAHVKTRAICIILGKRYPNCREMNKSSNKANAFFYVVQHLTLVLAVLRRQATIFVLLFSLLGVLQSNSLLLF